MPRQFAIIIGAMKSGTSSLFDLISQHPDVAGSTPKEPHFFTQRFEDGFDWYLDRWPSSGNGHKVLLEGSTSYTKLPAFSGAPERIAAVPDAEFRFLYIMRNPIQRIESHLSHALAEKWSDASADEAVESDSHFLEVSRYAKQLDPYYERFPAESILLVDFEEMRGDPTGVARRAQAFLGLTPLETFEGSDQPKNVGKGRITRDPVGNLVRDNPVLSAVGRLVPTSLKRGIREAFATRSKGNTRLTEAQRARVVEHLAEDQARLRDHYGFDTSRWNL